MNGGARSSTRSAPEPDDLVLEKTRPSFFAYTELDPILKSLVIRRLLIAENAPWDRAFTTPNYGRDPAYWDETAVTDLR